MHTDCDKALKGIASSHLRHSIQGAEPVEITLLFMNFVNAHDAGASDPQILNAVRDCVETAGGIFSFARKTRDERVYRTSMAIAQAAILMNDKHPDMSDLANGLTALSRQKFNAKTPVEIALLHLQDACKTIQKKLTAICKRSPETPENSP